MAIPLISAAQAEAILARMAYEVVERNYAVASLNLAGISTAGIVLCTKLSAVIKRISDKQIYTATLTLDNEPAQLRGAKLDEASPIVLVDDVLYTGLTLFNALAYCSKLQRSSLQAAVLVDRGHRNYPLAPDFVGLKLATTLQNFVRVTVGADGSLEGWLE